MNKEFNILLLIFIFIFTCLIGLGLIGLIIFHHLVLLIIIIVAVIFSSIFLFYYDRYYQKLDQNLEMENKDNKLEYDEI